MRLSRTASAPAMTDDTVPDLTPFAGATETHSGVVFFVGDFAYKMKKPVDLGFLDFRTREARERACHREVELNRRLAPDVYLGVADITGVDGEPCDHLVVMKRMPTDRRLASLVLAGADVTADLRQIAHLLAAFHAAAASSRTAATAASSPILAARWEDNHRTMAPFLGTVLDAEVAEATIGLARRYLAGRGPLFQARIDGGRAVDGHGDLLADDIFCLDDGPRILDCLEFDDELREGDVLADAAFLAMDLERLGRADLSARFLAHYQELTGDNWPASPAHHHIAYRAHVRAKVACVRAAQGDSQAAGQAALLLALSHEHLERARVRLVLVGGLPGTGKSTVAAGLGRALDAVVIRSDEVRKELLGLAPTDAAPAPYGRGAYTSESTEATYEAMLERAGSLLAVGESVVLDATWLDPVWRQRAQELARTAVADSAEIRCTVPMEVAAARMRVRTASGGDPSDATPEIAEVMAAADRGWPGDIELDTSGRVEDVIRAAVELLRSVSGRDATGAV
jgi:uncharacterized protein